jgi:hypothetical protein
MPTDCPTPLLWPRKHQSRARLALLEAISSFIASLVQPIPVPPPQGNESPRLMPARIQPLHAITRSSANHTANPPCATPANVDKSLATPAKTTLKQGCRDPPARKPVGLPGGIAPVRLISTPGACGARRHLRTIACARCSDSRALGAGAESRASAMRAAGRGRIKLRTV